MTAMVYSRLAMPRRPGAFNDVPDDFADIARRFQDS
jgi:hypothetical protein